MLLLAGLLVATNVSAYTVVGGVVQDSLGNPVDGQYVYSGAFGGAFEGYIGNVHLGLPTVPASNIGTPFLVTNPADLTNVANYTINGDDRFALDGSTTVHWYKFTTSMAGSLDAFYEWDNGISSFKLEVFSYGGSDTALSTDVFDQTFISTNNGHFDDLGFVTLPAAGDWLIRIEGNGLDDGLINEGYSVYLAPTTVVPLPPAALLFISALAGFGVIGRKKASKAA